jgi:serine/threonine protein kinase
MMPAGMGSSPAGAGALVGRRLGQYELVALLAVGGTAEIYLARIGGAAGFEKYVVVKCLHDHLAEDAEFVQMFLDEARLGAQLEHSNIVNTLALGEHEGRYFMVMEFLAGLSLAVIGRRSVERVPGKKVPVPVVLTIAAQVCTGLHYAHERTASGAPMGVVHRDISPQNLVIGFEGVVKLVDFGIAKASSRTTQTQAGTIKGKFAYMSPEQAVGGAVDRRTDVFALGIVVHELLTGKRLFKRGSAYDTYQAILACEVPAPSTVNRALDPDLDPVILRALAHDPDQRYPSAEAFGEALISYLHQHGGHASAADITRFLEQYFAREIDEHVARMRELIEGRETSLLSWDVEGDSAMMSVIGVASEGEELTPVEEIVFPAGGQPASDDVGDDDDAGEATRIEARPMAEIFAMEAEAQRADSGRRQTTIQDEQPPAHLPAIPPPPAIVLGPPPGSGLRDLGPRPGFPSQPVPTIIIEPAAAPPPPTLPASQPVAARADSGPRRGFAVAPDARTQIHGPDAPPGGHGLPPDMAQTLIGQQSPFAPQSVPAGTPSGMPATTGGYPATTGGYPAAPYGAPGELPLPAHLIGLPGYADLPPPYVAPVTARVHRSRPWLLPLLFVVALVGALAVTIGLAKVLT